MRVRDAFLNILQVISHVDSVGVQLAVVHRYRQLRRDRLQQFDVFGVEGGATFLVDDLRNPGDAAIVPQHWDAQHAPGPEPGFPVELGIEAIVLIGIRYVYDLAAGCRVAGQPGTGREPDLFGVDP